MRWRCSLKPPCLQDPEPPCSGRVLLSGRHQGRRTILHHSLPWTFKSRVKKWPKRSWSAFFLPLVCLGIGIWTEKDQSDDFPELLLELWGKKKPFFSLGSAGCEKQAAGATSGPLWHHVGRTKLNKVNPVTGRQTDRVTSSDQTGTSLALAWKVPCPRPPSDLGTQGRLVTSQRQSPAYTVPSLDPALLGGPPWAPQFYDPVSSGVCLSNFELCFCHMQLKES